MVLLHSSIQWIGFIMITEVSVKTEYSFPILDNLCIMTTYSCSKIIIILCIVFVPVIDRPDVKYLRKYVSGKVYAAGADKWWHLGIVLMGQDALNLDVIRADHPYNVEGCCSSMFAWWLERTPEASWRQLIEALKEVQLDQLASELKESLQSGIVTSEKQWPLKSQELLDLKFKGIIVWNNGCDECFNT